jgi:bacteriocin-like protein
MQNAGGTLSERELAKVTGGKIDSENQDEKHKND